MNEGRKSKLHELENRALGGDIAATIRVISLGRLLRKAAEQLLASRQPTGEVDAASVDCFESESDEAAAVATDGMPW